ncbi:hypothetical protein FACS1894202_01630 [Clostridia bacterium]|nr:hypothetical protein FACS1894202_01630 [Clostridia bacterium]
MVLLRLEIKKAANKMWPLVFACFCLNILGAGSISRSIDSEITLSSLFGRYLPNITLECVIITLLLTHFIIGYEHSYHTENLVYSAKVGRKCLLYKLAAAVCLTFVYSITLFSASLAAYFIKGGVNNDWLLFAKVLPLSFALILLFVLFAFTVGTLIRNPWAATIITISVNVLWLGIVMNSPDIHKLRLPPMGLLVSQKSWFTNIHGTNFELLGLAFSGVILTILCYSAYLIFRRREI